MDAPVFLDEGLRTSNVAGTTQTSNSFSVVAGQPVLVNILLSVFSGTPPAISMPDSHGITWGSPVVTQAMDGAANIVQVVFEGLPAADATDTADFTFASGATTETFLYHIKRVPNAGALLQVKAAPFAPESPTSHTLTFDDTLAGAGSGVIVEWARANGDSTVDTVVLASSGYTKFDEYPSGSGSNPGALATTYATSVATGATQTPGMTSATDFLRVAGVAFEFAEAGGGPADIASQGALQMAGAIAISGDIQIVSGNAQFSAPSADVSTGAWGPTSGVSLYAMIDEADPSDADYIRTATPGDVCVVALEAATDPGVSTGHVVSYRIMGDGSSGLQVSLMQGGTPIASWTHDPAPTDWTTYAQTLSTGEADAITDYAALRLRFTEV